jgi:hypothetical protein
MRPTPFILALMVMACSGEDESEPVTCERTDRTGTYWMEFETLSGNCGPQNASLVRLDADMGASSGCVMSAEPRWSDADCTLESGGTCPFDALEPGATVQSTLVTTQQDSAGDVITGTATMTIIGADGVGLCNGSYRVTATRQ